MTHRPSADRTPDAVYGNDRIAGLDDDPDGDLDDERDSDLDGAPVRVTFVLWDGESDGVAVLHNGEQVWADSSFDRLDQYLRNHAPIGVPVILDHLTRD